MTGETGYKTQNAFLTKWEEWCNRDHEFNLQVEIYGLEYYIHNREEILPKPQKPDIRQRKYTKTVAAA